MSFFSDLAASDIGRTAIIPFAVAFLASLFIRVGGGKIGQRIAALGLGIGFFVAYWLIDGIPSFPPPATKHKVFYVAAICLALVTAFAASVPLAAAERLLRGDDVAA